MFWRALSLSTVLAWGPRPTVAAEGPGGSLGEPGSAAAPSHAASLSQSLLPAALLSAQPLTQCGCKTLVLSQGPFAPAFGGINDCAHSVQSPGNLI